MTAMYLLLLAVAVTLTVAQPENPFYEFQQQDEQQQQQAPSDDSLSCPEHKSKCQLASGEWGCCSLASIEAGEKLSAMIVGVSSLEGNSTLQGPLGYVNWCARRIYCHHGHTCCRLPNWRWGCCPYSCGTCCTGSTYCCPHGRRCSYPAGRCY